MSDLEDRPHAASSVPPTPPRAQSVSQSKFDNLRDRYTQSKKKVPPPVLPKPKIDIQAEVLEAKARRQSMQARLLNQSSKVIKPPSSAWDIVAGESGKKVMSLEESRELGGLPTVQLEQKKVQGSNVNTAHNYFLQQMEKASFGMAFLRPTS